MKYRITDSNMVVGEDWLRAELLKYESENITNNAKAYINEELNLDNQLKCIDTAQNGTIEEVIYMLGTNWNVPIEPIVEDFNLQIAYTNGNLYIGTENSSGCRYECKNMAEIKDSIIEYINNYV